MINEQTTEPSLVQRISNLAADAAALIARFPDPAENSAQQMARNLVQEALVNLSTAAWTLEKQDEEQFPF